MEISRMTNEEVIKKYSETVYKLALARTEQPSDADDVYQEVFLRYINSKPRFNSEEHALAWFIKVTLNVTRSMFSLFENSKRADIDEPALKIAISEDNVDFAAEIEQRADVDEITAKMKPKYKTVLYLYYNCGYTQKEIGRLLHMKESGVKSLMMRARRIFRNLMLERDDNNE